MTIKQNGGVFGRNPTFNNVTVEGTLAVEGATEFTGDLVVDGNLTVNGATTTIESTTLQVEDPNILLGKDNTTDVQADGGGITVKGATNKTLTWVDATDAWTSNQNLEVSKASTPAVIRARQTTNGVTGSLNASDGNIVFVGAETAHPLGLVTNGTTRLTVPSNAAGLIFPATQVASSDVNCLDDYEEGTWTPVYTPGTGGFTTLGAVNNGQYVKIGKVVYVWGSIRTTGTPDLGTASGQLYITGLPFTVASVGGYAAFSIFQSWNLASALTSMGIILEANTTRAYFTKNSSNSGVTYVQATELSTATTNFGNLAGFFGMYNV